MCVVRGNQCQWVCWSLHLTILRYLKRFVNITLVFICTKSCLLVSFISNPEAAFSVTHFSLPWDSSYQCTTSGVLDLEISLLEYTVTHNHWFCLWSKHPKHNQSTTQPGVLKGKRAPWADECLFGYISCHRVEDQWIVPAILAKWSGCGLETTHQTLMVMIQVEILNTAFRNGPLTELAQAHEKIKCNGWHLLTNHLTAQT